MTYVSKKEKVFDLPEQEEASSVSLKNTDTRLKNFPSVSDRRAWTTEEQQRYQHLYGLVSGSETNVAKSSSSFKYIPFDVLLGILMAEKDAYIQELLERQDEKSCSGGGKLYRAEGFEDSDDDRDALIRKDAEVVALKNKIASLESELEDYRDTFTKAMHKLENMDAVMSENNMLREKVKCLEEQKRDVENELWNMRRSSESESEMEEKSGRWTNKKDWEKGDWENEISRLASERDILKSQVDELQRELQRAKTNAAEIEVLRKISETTSNSLEEVTKENKNYKKKLETMKCLEKHVEELQKQAHTLTDKYKRESQKASDQLKQIKSSAKEVQALKEERDRLQKRVEELISYESQYFSLQSKLHQVEMILDENEFLNKKLIQLDKLELENEHLKIKIEQLKSTEIQAAADKQKIIQLQCEVVDQEEEIRKMLRQIEELSDGYADKNEVYRLKNELEEKNGKLKQFEQQVAEIPVLETEIEELKNKLQKCIDDFTTDKDLLRRLQEELEACRNRCQELEEMAQPYNNSDFDNVKSFEFGEDIQNSISENKQEENKQELKIAISTEEAKCQTIERKVSEKGVEVKLSLLEVGVESFDELQELEEKNQVLRKEVDVLRSKLSEINLDDFLQQTNGMKELLKVKDEKIVELEAEIHRLKQEVNEFENIEIQKLQQNREEVKQEIKSLKEINEKLMVEVEKRQDVVKRTKELESVLIVERKARAFAMDLARDLDRQLSEEKRKQEVELIVRKLQKEEANVARQDMYQSLSLEIFSLKLFKTLSYKVINELKVENKILREMKEHAEKVEIKGLKNLTRKLRAKVKALKGLSKPDLQAEYKAVQEKVKILLKETDTLVNEINSLKVALDSEKKTKDYLEKELIALQAEISACLTAGSKVLNEELAARDVLILELKKELTETQKDLTTSVKEIQMMRVENAELKNKCNGLQSKESNLMSEIAQLAAQIEEQKSLETEINRLSEQIEKQKTIEMEFNKFTSSIQQREQAEKSDLCKIDEHKNLEEKLCLLSKQLENDTKEIVGKEVKEREYLSEIIALKKNLEEHKCEVAKLRALEQELKFNLMQKEAKITSIIDANREYVKKEELREKEIKEMNLKAELEESRALEEAMKKIENELGEFKRKLSDCQKIEDEMVDMRRKRDSLQEKIASFESEMLHLKEKLNEFEELKIELEELKAEKGENNILELLAQLENKQKEVENLKTMNENLQSELSKAENMLEVSKKLHKTASQLHTLPPSAEFFTPPALPSPRSSEHLESERESEEMMPVETHIRELTNLENHFMQEIQKLKVANLKKVKKLTGQHEKDAKSRTKAFHDSINNIKSNYENGIRKLVEKHKISIHKLQELHEEEVEELHKNYETQMMAMEKQNEDLINDMKTKSVEKCKKMVEEHNRELQQMQTKYEEMLKKKEAQAQADIANAESNISQNANELQEAHKATVDKLTQFYQSSILELEDKHNKQLKKCKKSHLEKLELMKNKYEDLLTEERKKYEEQLEKMLHQLKKGQHETATNDSLPNNFIQRRTPPVNPWLEFIEVLQKIINEGLESLTFDELILVHSKTCFVPESINNHDERGGGELNIEEVCRHKVLMAAEKEELLKRIFTLEREIIIKQLETHEAIVNMEEAEKFRIQELKHALFSAQQKNSELERHLSKFEMDMKIEKHMMNKQTSFNESSIMEKAKELEKEKTERKRMEDELLKERANVKNLTAILESEKERFRNQRKKDLDYVESIRLRLEEALTNEQMMESQLENEARFRAKLESELQSLQKSFNLITDGASISIVDSKTVKDYKNFDQCESTKKGSVCNRSRSRHKSVSKAVRGH